MPESDSMDEMNPEYRSLLIGTCAAGAMLVALSFGNLDVPPTIAWPSTEHVWSPQGATQFPATGEVVALRAVELTGMAPTTLLDPALSGILAGSNVVAVAPDRATTVAEEVAGDFREWALLSANWDGEGSRAPNADSLKAAAEFVLLSNSAVDIPTPMLLASGRAGLFWNTPDMRADLEFVGSDKVTYYVERGENNKHKGVVNFDGKTLPPILKLILSA